MTTRIADNGGHRSWKMQRDSEGHREYSITYRTESDTTRDGPALHLQTSGLPTPGSVWRVDNDIDDWAYCLWDAEVIPVVDDGDPNRYFDCTFKFSTKPPDNKKCVDRQWTDPLLQPAKVNGQSVKYQEEATVDAYGRSIVNSAWEQIRGREVEFDKNRSNVKIEINTASLDFALCNYMIDKLNGYPLWGLSRRQIKLSDFTWERAFYGQCFVYYKKTFTFDIRANPDDSFDRSLLDEGTKVLNGHWNTANATWVLDKIDGKDPDRFNPAHFKRFKDLQGENSRVVLDGKGKPSGVSIGTSGPLYLAKLSSIGSALPVSPATNNATWQLANLPARDWTSSDTYAVGDVVKIDSDIVTAGSPASAYYLALTASTGSTPPSANWLLLPDGIKDKGTWTALGIYAVGEYVTPGTTISSAAGKIFVAKYQEVDFTLLGIPITF